MLAVAKDNPSLISYLVGELLASKAKKFRAHDIQTLRRSFEFFESEPDMINFAKLSREELEGILKEDQQDA